MAGSPSGTTTATSPAAALVAAVAVDSPMLAPQRGSKVAKTTAVATANSPMLAL